MAVFRGPGLRDLLEQNIAGLRIHSQGLQEAPQGNKFLRSKKKSGLGICKRPEATREKEKENVALSAQD